MKRWDLCDGLGITDLNVCEALILLRLFFHIIRKCFDTEISAAPRIKSWGCLPYFYIVSFDRTCVILGCWDSQYTILSERFSPKLHLIWRLKANSPLVMITKNSSFTILQDIDIHFFQVVSGAVKIMESSDIVWTHLHEAEMFFKGKRNLIQRLILVW